MCDFQMGNSVFLVNVVAITVEYDVKL